MSIFRPVRLACPSCGEGVSFQAVSSVNADRAPHLRRQIVDETFQREECAACGTSFRLAPSFSLVDHGRDSWIAALPAGERGEWPEHETAAAASFARAYGPGASPGIREIGSAIRRRVTFGWAAIREKLVAQDMHLDDLTLELTKMALLRSSGSAPIGASTELRLLGGDATRLAFGWLLSSDESLVEGLEVERAAYDEIAADAGGDWADLRADFDGALFVDMGRLTIATA
jgi:CpXC protein